MEFEEIPLLSVKPNQKYKIQWKEHEYIATFYQFYNNGIDFIKVYRKGLQLPYIRFYECKIYKPLFQQKKRQKAMERRAVNMILQRIIGDPYFVW